MHSDKLAVHSLVLLVWGWLLFRLPWVPEVFLSCSGNFRCWPKADTSSAAGHYKDLTETGNRARKVSGTQGIFRSKRERVSGKVSNQRVVISCLANSQVSGAYYSALASVCKYTVIRTLQLRLRLTSDFWSITFKTVAPQNVTDTT